MLAAPARERIRFIIADMAHRSGWIDRPKTAQRHGLPLAIALAPMSRRFPAFVADGGKAIRQPKRGSRIAVVLHEGEPIGIGDEIAVQPDRADQRAMRRLLVVEMEGVVA